MVSVVCKFWVLGSGKLRIYKLEIVLGRYLPVGVGQLLVGGVRYGDPYKYFDDKISRDLS